MHLERGSADEVCLLRRKFLSCLSAGYDKPLVTLRMNATIVGGDPGLRAFLNYTSANQLYAVNAVGLVTDTHNNGEWYLFRSEST